MSHRRPGPASTNRTNEYELFRPKKFVVEAEGRERRLQSRHAAKLFAERSAVNAGRHGPDSRTEARVRGTPLVQTSPTARQMILQGFSELPGGRQWPGRPEGSRIILMNPATGPRPSNHCGARLLPRRQRVSARGCARL